MSKFTYTEASGRIRVLLDGKRVGTIYRERGTVAHGSGGYYYQPSGGAPGAAFPTLEAVKKSVEEREVGGE